MINKWADKGKFTVIKVGSRVRILRDEFEGLDGTKRFGKEHAIIWHQ